MNSLLNTPLVSLSFNQVLLNLALSVLLGTAIAWVYKRTHKGVSYSQSYVVSLVLVAVITATVIMVIGNSLTRAFGLIGAFAVIRFRTAVKDTRDIVFLFFSLVEGMASGTGNYQIAILAFIVFTAVVFVLTRSKFAQFSNFDYLVTFQSLVKPGGKAKYLKVFDKYLIDHFMLSMRTGARSSQLFTSYNITFKDPQKIKEFIVSLRGSGVSHIELLSSGNDVDY